MNTTPLTPDLTATGIMQTKIPNNWLPAFTFITMSAMKHPEVAAFPILFLAAFNGNENALTKILETVFVAHYAAHNFANSKDEIAMSNAIIYLGNKLAESLERKELPFQIEDEAASPKKSAPVKKAEGKPTPVSDPKLKFRKPGEMHAR